MPAGVAGGTADGPVPGVALPGLADGVAGGAADGPAPGVAPSGLGDGVAVGAAVASAAGVTLPELEVDPRKENGGIEDDGIADLVMENEGIAVEGIAVVGMANEGIEDGGIGDFGTVTAGIEKCGIGDVGMPALVFDDVFMEGTAIEGTFMDGTFIGGIVAEDAPLICWAWTACPSESVAATAVTRIALMVSALPGLKPPDNNKSVAENRRFRL